MASSDHNEISTEHIQRYSQSKHFQADVVLLFPGGLKDLNWMLDWIYTFWLLKTKYWWRLSLHFCVIIPYDMDWCSRSEHVCISTSKPRHVLGVYSSCSEWSPTKEEDRCSIPCPTMQVQSFHDGYSFLCAVSQVQTAINSNSNIYWVLAPPLMFFFFSPLKLLKLTSAVGQISKLLNVCKDCWKEHPSIIRPCTGAPHKSLQAEASDLNLIRHL